jgi:hypothetical protein
MWMVHSKSVHSGTSAEPLAPAAVAQLKTVGSLEPLNAEALPPGGLRQDHHGYDTMPVSPANAKPFHADLSPISPLINSSAGGVVSMLVATDNSSIVSRQPHHLKVLVRCILMYILSGVVLRSSPLHTTQLVCCCFP